MQNLIVSNTSLSDSKTPRIILPSNKIETKVLSGINGLEIVIKQIDILNENPPPEVEEKFHRLEKNLVKDNAESILSFAKCASEHLEEIMKLARSGWDELHHFNIEPPSSFEEALIYRYIYVPLAYRLGYYTLAPKLAQMTFEKLLPKLEGRVAKAVREFLHYSEGEAHSLVHARFTLESSDISYCYSRPKTPHSIWKKVGSVVALDAMTQDEFLTRVDDYIMVVWSMKVNARQQRQDALENGTRLFNQDKELCDCVKRYTSNVNAGFPVAMIHAVWRGIPVEIQFLGGEILGWLTAMDYTKYKVGTTLDNIEERLTPSEWARRGETMLRIYEASNLRVYEEGVRSEFHQILLDELLKKSMTYDNP